MRHVFAVASVIILSLSLGITAGYFSVDLTPPGLDLLRPKAPEVVASIEEQEKARTIQAAASGCKYCADIAELAKTFTRRGQTARAHASALETALTQVSDEKALFGRRTDELQVAKTAASRAEAAASILTGWAGRCAAEDFCKLPATQVAAATCASDDGSRSAAALLIAMSVRTVAQQCAGSTCPSVDCKSSAALRADMGRIEGALDEIGGNMSSVSPAQLPVGASTLNAEVTRIADETNYVANMLPLLLDMGKVRAGDLPKMAPELADQRAVSAAELAVVMEQAAGVSEVKNDPRLEASWRLKSLASHLAILGKSTVASTLNWNQAADALGASLLDLSRLHALVDRRASKMASGCDGTVASVAQQLREARAMLDHCRMRAACIGKGGADATVKASNDDIDEVFSRATVAAQGLIANELGDNVIQAADSPEPSLIEALRSQGVCRRASQLREASAAAPLATQAVAETLAPALSPSTGAVSPQDIVTGAVQSALNTPATASATPDVVPAAAPVKAGGDSELVQATAPASRQAATPQFTGSAFGFGGEGGPVITEGPEEAPKQ